MTKPNSWQLDSWTKFPHLPATQIIRLQDNSHTDLYYARLKGRGGSIVNAGSDLLLPLRLTSTTSELDKVFDRFVGTFGLRYDSTKLQPTSTLIVYGPDVQKSRKLQNTRDSCRVRSVPLYSTTEINDRSKDCDLRSWQIRKPILVTCASHCIVGLIHL